MGTFTFNGIRFAIGSLSLIPLIISMDKKKLSTNNSKKSVEENSKDNTDINRSNMILPGIIVGTILFAGSSIQQTGLIYTTAGNASFITGLYVVIVPIMGLFLKHKIGKNSWSGVGLAVIGLYLLSINENFSISYGDLLEVIGSLFWAIHILAIDHFSNKIDPLKLSCTQFATNSILSIITALFVENITLAGISAALIPILYGGLLSVGVAYTLQVVAQKNAKPSHAAIILSMESVFGAVGGALILNEVMSYRGYIGCILILSGIVVSQLRFPSKDLKLKEKLHSNA